MKHLGILIIVISMSTVSFANGEVTHDGLPSFDQNYCPIVLDDSMKLDGSACIKRITRSRKNGRLVLKVTVKSKTTLTAYPSVVAYFDGEPINEYKMHYYAHLKGTKLDYELEIPTKYAKLVKKLSFRIVQINGTYIELD